MEKEPAPTPRERGASSCLSIPKNPSKSQPATPQIDRTLHLQRMPIISPKRKNHLLLPLSLGLVLVFPDPAITASVIT